MSNSEDAKALALFERALEQPSTDRRDWILTQTETDSALREKVLQLFDADVTETHSIKTGGAAGLNLVDQDPPERVGAYKIKECLGQGGMGAVFKGERCTGDFEHIVAIKIIKPGLLSEKLQPRFKNEQQILASFSHPNIARLYDGGETEDGSPYILMEYIEGVPITDWANDKSLSVEARTELIITVCEAVSYAHQNLIVHRDLTPSNILVTQSGEVKLIDFGIAKPFVEGASDDAETESIASMSFTPGFAAPERALGSSVTTLTDVYSLGKILETLFPNDRSPADIAAIIRQATRTDPAARYTSVDALKDDLDNYLNDRPLEALEASWGYSAGKFFRRNRLKVLTSAMILIGLLGGLLATTHLYREAERARGVADQRFNDVRALAKTMMFDIYEDIDAVPGTLKAKQSLAQAAQQYLNELSLDASATDSLKIEAARGYVRLADILGSPRMSHTGDYSASKENIAKAEAIIDSLVSTGERSAEVFSAQREMAFVKATAKFYIDGKGDEATGLLRDSIRYAEQALQMEPDNLDFQTDVLGSKMELAINHKWNNLPLDAMTLISEVIDAYDALVIKAPDKVEMRQELAKALRTKAEFLSTMDTAKEAIPYARRALEVEQQLESDTDASDIKKLRAMAFSHWRLATPYWMIGQHEDAVSHLKQAIQYTEVIVQRDPGNEDAKRFIASYQGEAASSLVKLGQFEEAETFMQSSKAYFKTRLDDDPALGSSQRSMMVISAQLTAFYTNWGKEQQRCESLQQLKHYRDMMDDSGNLLESDRAGIKAYVESQPACTN